MNPRIEWRTAVLGGSDSDYGLNVLRGWLGTPSISFDSQPKTYSHGHQPTSGRVDPRIVYAAGHIRADESTRDALIAQLQAAMIPPPSTSTEPDALRITMAGRTRFAKAQLSNFDIDTDMRRWASGLVPWSAQWRCQDPRLFHPSMTVDVPLASFHPGLKMPFTMPQHLPPKPLGGRARVDNPGNDPEGSPVTVSLIGEQTGTPGVRNITTGVKVFYNLTIGPDDLLVIDTDRGGAFLNGQYRPPAPGSNVISDLRAQPGLNVYEALGTGGTGDPRMVVYLEPASF